LLADLLRLLIDRLLADDHFVSLNCPLWVNQLGQLSLSTLRDRQMSGFLRGFRQCRPVKRQTTVTYSCKATGETSVSAGLGCGLTWTPVLTKVLHF